MAITLLAGWPEADTPLQTNIQIPNTRYGTVSAQAGDEANHPHLCDVYKPGGVIRAVMVALHGGGGDKTQYAGSLGVLKGDPPSYSKVNWGLLEQARCALIVPQGQHCSGVNALWGAGSNPWNPNDVDTPAAKVWSSRVIWSGVDDVQFLRDMAGWIISTFGSDKTRVLVGHSAGGMMVCRMWYEHVSLATGYHAYCSSSSTPSAYFRDTAPTPPIDARPFAVEFGAQDANLGFAPDGTHFDDATLYLTANPTPAWVSWPSPPALMGAIQTHQARVDAYNAQHSLSSETITTGNGTTTPAASGTKTDWTNSNGQMRMRLDSDADHSNANQQAATGQKQLASWALFAVAQGG